MENAQAETDSIDALLGHLQDRMTHAVATHQRSVEYSRNPSAVYEVLADFFQTQKRQQLQAAEWSISAADSLSLLLFALQRLTRGRDAVSTWPLAAVQQVGHEEEEILDVIRHSPVMPVDDLREPLPVVAEADTTNAIARTKSAFSCVAHSLPQILEVCHVVDQALQLHTPPRSVAVVSFAAIATTLYPTLDMADAILQTAHLMEKATVLSSSRKGEGRDAGATRNAATILAAMYFIWSVVDHHRAGILKRLSLYVYQTAHRQVFLSSAIRVFATMHREALCGTAAETRGRDTEKVTKQDRETLAAPVADEPADPTSEIDSDFWARLAS